MDWDTVLLPLDGSDIAASALPYAAAMANAAGASVLLLGVVERELPGMSIRSQRAAAGIERVRQQRLRTAIDTAAATLRTRDIAVTEKLMRGDATAAILSVAQEMERPLIVMATRGRGGIDRAAVGSVADKIIRLAPGPVLAVRPAYYPVPSTPVSLTHLAVALDGSSLATEALGPAADLATALGAGLTLVRVEPWRTQVAAPLGTNAELMAIEEEAGAEVQAYLDEVRQTLPAALSVRTLLARGRPVDTLVDVVHHERIDLLVMTTRGWGGVRRLILGSVTDRIIRAGIPVLLVRPRQQPEPGEEEFTELPPADSTDTEIGAGMPRDDAHRREHQP